MCANGFTNFQSEPKRKYSNAVSEQFIEEKPNSRKTSGALISAGFEVSATVVNTMGTLGKEMFVISRNGLKIVNEIFQVQLVVQKLTEVKMPR